MMPLDQTFTSLICIRHFPKATTLNILFFLGLMLIAGTVFATPTYLTCEGTIVWQGREKGVVHYEITYNERNILSMTRGLAPACFEDEDTTPVKCECKITNKEITCSSIGKGKKNKSHYQTDTFQINRYSGRMTTNMFATGKSYNGEPYFFRNESDALCTKQEKQKF